MDRLRVALLTVAGVVLVSGVATVPALSAQRPSPSTNPAASARQPAGNAPTACAPAPCAGDSQAGGVLGPHQLMSTGATAAFSLSQHVLRVGDRVTATVTPRAGCASTGNCPVGWEWPTIDGVPPPCPPVTAAGLGVTSAQLCVYPGLTTLTTGTTANNRTGPQWRVATIHMQLSAGLDVADDFFLVLPAPQSAVEGRLNYPAGGAGPAAGTRIDFQGSDGQGFFLNSNADGYFYAVLAPGRYGLTPAPSDGTAVPTTRSVGVGGGTQEAAFDIGAPPPDLTFSSIEDHIGTLLFGGEVRTHSVTTAIRIVDTVFPTFNVRPPANVTWGGKVDWSGSTGTIKWDLGSLGAAGVRDITYQLTPRQVVANPGNVLTGIRRNAWTTDAWRGSSSEPVTLTLGGAPLVVSSAPEVIDAASGEGILYRQATPVTGAFRVAISHGAKGPRSRSIYLVLQAAGSSSATVQEMAWASSDDRATADGAARSAEKQYLDRQAAAPVSLGLVPPGGALAVRVGTLSGGSGARFLNGIFDLTATAPVRTTVVLVDAASGANFTGAPLDYRFNGTSDQTLAGATPLTAGPGGTRGTFAHDTIDVTLPQYPADDARRYGWRLDRAVLEPAQDTHESSASAYGILFRIHVNTTTSHPGTETQVLLNALSGSLSGAASAEGAPAFAAPASATLASPDQAVGLGQVPGPTDPAAPWTLAMMLSPSSHLPAALVLSPAFVRSEVAMTAAGATSPVVQTNIINLKAFPPQPPKAKPASDARAYLAGLAVILIPVAVMGGVWLRGGLEKKLRRRRRHRRRAAHEAVESQG